MASKKPDLTIAKIIDLLGGPRITAEICGFRNNLPQRGGDMRRRGSIPVQYWPSILKDAKLRRIPEITPVSLIEAHVGYRLEL